MQDCAETMQTRNIEQAIIQFCRRMQASIDALRTDVLSNQGGSTAPQANISLVQHISGEIEQHIEQDSYTRWSTDSMQNMETGMAEIRSMLQDMAAMAMVHGEIIQRTEVSVEDTQQRVRSLRTPIQSAHSTNLGIVIVFVLIVFVIYQ